MNEKESKLSDYIDSLNEEKKPKEYGDVIEGSEIEELFEYMK